MKIKWHLFPEMIVEKKNKSRKALFQFSQEVIRVSGSRALDIPGNGYDVYTKKDVSIRYLKKNRYELRLARHFQVGHQLFFLLHWKRRKTGEFEQLGFVLEGDELLYFRYN